MPIGRTWGSIFGLCLVAATAPAPPVGRTSSGPANGTSSGPANGTSSGPANALGIDQEQPPAARRNWPCGARVDPAYFKLAEASGGELLMLAPWEAGTADSDAQVKASFEHTQTIFRIGGTINPGTHEFRVPIDASVESVMFSISAQCLQSTEVVGPSGDGVTDLSSFVALRVVVVRRPAVGTWRIRAAGSGVAGVMVKARSTLSLTRVEFAAPGVDRFGPVPTVGVENVVRISVDGRPAHVEAAIVNAAFKEIEALALKPVDGGETYLARFTPRAEPYRVLIRGTDAGGAPFQRVDPRLHMAEF